MKEKKAWWQKRYLKRIAVSLLAAVAFLIAPALFQINAFSAQAQTLVAEVETDTPDSGTIKRIQQKAEDFNSDKIGDTGLKNIRKLPENVPETSDLIVRQRFGDDPKDEDDSFNLKEAFDRTIDRASEAIKGK